MAYLTLYPGAKKWAGPWRSLETAFNYLLIAFGFYMLIAGTYVSDFSAQMSVMQLLISCVPSVTMRAGVRAIHHQ